ncbi:uncharacterized protein EI97DRAFT_205885 [Westerdykella ornata]|uniref:SSD domain-containing protein n=1 Tax=Westerdykella ornata TaxID=318751 RepID=A0A6A6JBL7_WESOR|nr:uncharacterized protein EI97DRAFT_205885 [Westerdykella ornata]KAF2272579.1 hypothetical protein EI97DRAFT_205885 [Westerdykella ornata]
MIWYILYPFRGTTEPPRLSPSHPLRRAFLAHGTATAQHWLLSILLIVVVSILLCYPAVFQTDSPAAAGLRNLPKHVWTSTTEVADVDQPVDVEVRQVWVHGDYMKAIDRRVLREALRVQNVLISHGFDNPDGDLSNTVAEYSACSHSRGADWAFHSPLMYWNCSLPAMEKDPDPLATINSRSTHQTAVNLTLRPSTVFAGKVFANKRLRAADALVITLFHRTGSTLGYAWESRSRQLAQNLTPGWSIFPKDGQVHRSRLYEFRFKPMTLSDDLLLGGSYFVVAVYVIWRMMQLRAVKSKSGLLLTICAKMIICVIASFTICTYLGIDLARIPRPWFPGVVFCFGLGNIFRLINVVLETPPEMPPPQRIGNALGEVGHLSLAVAGQNLVLIYLLSRIVTPLVSDFCVFAAVTLVLDFVFHLTFFVAVLSVDVQRMELQDSLERVDPSPASKSGRQGPQSWLTALRQGNLPVSTRFAGSAAILSMILAVNWHFFDRDTRELSPRKLARALLARTTKPQPSSFRNATPINQARAPAEWFRIQDHNTAKELFGFIKPNAHSFIARVHDPLLVVLEGAQGRDTPPQSTSLIEHVRRFTHQHAFPAALLVVFVIAGVTLLMNYLLWDGFPHEDTSGGNEEENADFSIRTLPVPQNLDIVALTSGPKGHLVSVSLDRSTSIWQNRRSNGYTNTILRTAAMKPKLWPVVACTIDDGGSVLALVAEGGQIGFWSIAGACFILFAAIELRGQIPLLCSFICTQSGGEHDRLSLVLVTSDGHLTVVDASSGKTRAMQWCSSHILSAALYTSAKGSNSVVYVSKPGEVYIMPLEGTKDWTPEVVAGLDPGPPPGSNPSKIKSVYASPSIGLIFAIRAGEVEIFDFSSRAIVHSHKIGIVKAGTFRVMHSSRRPCACGAPAVTTLSFAYTEHETHRMIMHTFCSAESGESRICLGKPSDSTQHGCRGLQHAKETIHCVDSAGVWESTSILSVVGIRRCAPATSPSPTDSDADGDLSNAEAAGLASASNLRPFKAKAKAKPATNLSAVRSAFTARHTSDVSGTDFDSWEAWTLSSSGRFRSRPLLPDLSLSQEDAADLTLSQQQLFVASPGPISRVGSRSVAVAFGNTVKIISLGKDSFFNTGLGAAASNVEDGALDFMSLGGGAGVGSYKSKGRRGTGRKML